MRTLTLQRFAESPDGTLGEILDLATFEEEDRDNEVGESRIPAGTYTCERSYFHKGGYHTFEVVDVPGRTEIKFHKGNTEEDTAGCILIGKRHGTLMRYSEDGGEYRPKVAVLQSAVGFLEFMAYMRGVDRFRLVVKDVPWREADPDVRIVDSGSEDIARRDR